MQQKNWLWCRWHLMYDLGINYTWRSKDREKGNSQKRKTSLAEIVAFGKHGRFKAKTWAVHFGCCKVPINGMEEFKVRKVSWVRPSGALNDRISSFSPMLPKVFHIRLVGNDDIFMAYWDKQQLCTDRGDDKKWGDYAPSLTRHQWLQSFSTSVVLLRDIYVKKVGFLSRQIFSLRFQFKDVLSFMPSTPPSPLLLFFPPHTHRLLTATRYVSSSQFKYPDFHSFTFPSELWLWIVRRDDHLPMSQVP